MADKAKKVGVVTHYFDHLGVAIVKFSAPVKVGDTLRYKNADRVFEAAFVEMQSEHQAIEKAKKGHEVGIKVSQKVKKDDEVYLVN